MVQTTYFFIQAYNRVGKYEEAISDCDTAIKVGAHTHILPSPPYTPTHTHAHTHPSLTHTHPPLPTLQHTHMHTHTPPSHTYPLLPSLHTHTYTPFPSPPPSHTHTPLVCITLSHTTLSQLEPNTLKAYLQKGKANASLHKLNQVHTRYWVSVSIF